MPASAATKTSESKARATALPVKTETGMQTDAAANADTWADLPGNLLEIDLSGPISWGRTRMY